MIQGLIERTLLAVLTALLMALVHLLALTAAPAPKARPARIKALDVVPGRWSLAWNGSNQLMTLTAQGAYTWGGTWEGSWRYDASNRTLYVTEKTVWDQANPPRWTTWAVKLSAAGEGTTTSETGWANNVKVKVAVGAPKKERSDLLTARR